MHSVEAQSQMARVQILVRGIVQGVGFRPYVFSLARRSALKGQVFNNNTGVFIDVEGEESSIEQFIKDLTAYPPPLSLIESIERSDDLDPAHYRDFHIVESASAGDRFVPLSPDVATCEDCLRELLDPRDRRYRYPFINCTNCGPRFTIIEDIPYDRRRTTMRDFAMCDECRVEYENPLDRRFHAEPTACPRCGPQLTLTDARGREITLGPAHEEDAITRTRLLLSRGKIIAVKGIGGFHLACDALNAEAVERLRRSKYREDKPFALMARSLDVIREYCFVSQAEEALLSSAPRPIVLLEKRPGATLPPAVAPSLKMLGFMLPYTPLHHLLLENCDGPLVLTSGNISDEPICYEDGEAAHRLDKIADYFLLHDRRIHIRADDSVVRACAGREMILRRARGYAPAPIKTSCKFARGILACGAELKNTFCLTHGHYAFVSHHIGDLENLETLRSFTEGIEHYKRLFHLQPEIIAYDLHPEYLSTKYALSLDEIETKIGVQHHHAHIASCMADNGIEGEVIGVALDGLGFGTDGRFWGGEFFVADFLTAERVAHLDYMPLPGGAQAIREPWRMAATYLQRAVGDDFLSLHLPSVQQMDRRAWATLRRMAATGLNSPETSSMGRLFDAVSGLLNLRSVVNYEGQAAIELEALADPNCKESYEFEIDVDKNSNASEDARSVPPAVAGGSQRGNHPPATAGGTDLYRQSPFLIKAECVIRRAVDDLLGGAPPAIVSAKFHFGVARLIAALAQHIRNERQLNHVVLSGGVFQNMLLLERTCRLLRQDGFAVFTHARVPPNDGGISLGQAVIANARIASGRI